MNKNDSIQESAASVPEENAAQNISESAVQPETKASAGKKKREKKPVNRKRRKKIKKVVTIIVILIAALLIIAWKAGIFKKLGGSGKDMMSNQLSTYCVTTNTITKTLTSSGTLEPNDSYTITPLVSGEILNDYFEEGDIVEEDQLLYEIDSSNVESNVKRAQNSLKNAQRSLDDALEKREKLSVKSKNEGTIEKIYVEVGDEINAGTKIAEIIDKDTMCIDVPFMSTDAANFTVGSTAVLTFDSNETMTGTVTEISGTTGVSALGVVTRNVTISVKNTGGITPATTAYAQIGDAVCTSSSAFYYNDEGEITAEISGTVEKLHFNEGDRISKDQVIVTLSSSDLDNQIESLELSLDDAKSSLDDALDVYDNYNITSPISGTVISKDYKAGDTLGNSGNNNGGTSMAVIYDMSAFKFKMNIDELDIDSLSVGQDVIVTSDARQGDQYHGTVTAISVQGTTTNGTTSYPVTVTIENEEDESLRTVDEDGTIHKTYKTGKTSVTNTYKLASSYTQDGATVYAYEDGTVIKAYFAEDGTVSYYAEDKILHHSDSGYTLGSDIYAFGSGMEELTLEKVDDSKMLRPGMNVDAEIFVEKVENVVAVPVSAVMRGYKVKVIKRASDVPEAVSDGNISEKTDIPQEKADNIPESAGEPENKGFNGERGQKNGNRDGSATVNSNMPSSGELSPGQYGVAENDAEYEEVQVEVGINDNSFVEITSGLSVGDVVILDEMNAMSFSNSENQEVMYGGGFGGGYGGPRGGGMMMG